MPESVLTIAEVAKILKLSDKSVYALVKKGTIPSFKLGSQYRVTESIFNQWLLDQNKEQSLKKGKEK